MMSVQEVIQIVGPVKLTYLVRQAGVHRAQKGVNARLEQEMVSFASRLLIQARAYQAFRRGNQLEIRDVEQALVDVNEALARMRKAP